MKWLACFLPLLFYAETGGMLQITRGHYSPYYLIIYFLLWVGTVASLYGFQKWRNQNECLSIFQWRRVTAGLALYFALRLALRPEVHRQVDHLWIEFRIVLAAAAALMAAVVFVCHRGIHDSAEGTRPSGAQVSSTVGYLSLGACLLLIVARVMTILLVPHPPIDVHIHSTEAVDYLLSGVNPYPQKYTDVYHGLYAYPPAYYYWPGVLYLQAPFRWLFGDVRYAFVAAEIVTALGLFRIGRTVGTDSVIRWLLPVLWLAFPVALFELEQAWIDTFLVTFSTLVAWMLLERRRLAGALFLGIFCSVKQYSVFFAVLSGLWVLREAGLAKAMKFTAWTTLVFGVIVLPFLLLHPESFVGYTILGHLQMPMRADSLSLIAFVKRVFGLELSGALYAPVYLLALLGAVYGIVRVDRDHPLTRFASWAAGLILVHGAVFLFGKQAFLNYYYLLAVFALFWLIAAVFPNREFLRK